MKRVLCAPTICVGCRYPTRFAASVFVNGRGWQDLCPACDFRVAGIPQVDPAKLPIAAEIVIPAGACR